MRYTCRGDDNNTTAQYVAGTEIVFVFFVSGVFFFILYDYARHTRACYKILMSANAHDISLRIRYYRNFMLKWNFSPKAFRI